MNIYETMGLPSAARIDRVVAKKQFYDNGDLSTADKRLFENVNKIHWLYALKTETTFIPSFCDGEREYPEIEVLEVNLRAEKQLNRLAEVIMRAIPYPMLLLFRLGNKVRLYMGKLRQNQADSERMTLTDVESTDWLTENADFWQGMALGKLPTANFCTVYEAWFDAISKSHLAAMSLAAEELTGDEAREKLARLQAIELELSKLRNQMKKESQFNRKLELNSRLQKLKKEQKSIMEQGSRAQ